MADLIYPRRGHIMGATPFEPMKILIGDKPMVGMVVGSEFMVVDNDGKMDTYNPIHGNVTFLGYLTREESFTIIGSEDPAWVMPDIKEDPLTDIKRGRLITYVPDFVPYWCRTGGGTVYCGINIPMCAPYNGRIAILRYLKQNGTDAWTNLRDTGLIFEKFMDDQTLDSWRNHTMIKRRNGQDPSLWPS